MTLWLIRAGSRGEHEQKCLDEGKVYLTWGSFTVDVSSISDRQGLIHET